MTLHEPIFEARLARDPGEVAQAQGLRYEVFVRELGGGGALVDHAARLEADRFDPFCEHLLLWDRAASGGGRLAGVYRLMTDEQAAGGIGFYSAGEYDLAPLIATGRRLLELGRSCLDPAYRGGAAMFHLWTALADLVEARGMEILFGVASFHGTDLAALAGPLAYLHHWHLAPPALRARAQGEGAQAMDLLPVAAIDRKAAMLTTPALIKAYLRLGGHVGEGAFVDRAFNTTDVLMVMDTARMNDRHRLIYSRARP